MQDKWIERLSEFVDDELPATERPAFEAHIAECGDCREAVAALRAVRDAARTLPGLQPARDLWPGIESRLERATTRRMSFSIPAAIAAGLFIALASGLGTWAVVHRPVDGDSTVTTASPNPGSKTGRPYLVALNSAPYDRAIADLLTTLRSERRDLSPRTIDTIERSLAVIDRAIADAQAALERDPTDTELVSYLSDRQRARLAVLRQVERFAPEAPEAAQ